MVFLRWRVIGGRGRCGVRRRVVIGSAGGDDGGPPPAVDLWWLAGGDDGVPLLAGDWWSGMICFPPPAGNWIEGPWEPAFARGCRGAWLRAEMVVAVGGGEKRGMCRSSPCKDRGLPGWSRECR